MYDTIVVSGGGVKIICAIGGVKYLESVGILSKVTNFYGTSAGSILCSLITLGYTIKEIEYFAVNFEYCNLFDPNLDLLVETCGLCTSEKLAAVLKLLIWNKTGDSDISMAKLHTLTGKNLNITSTCVETCESCTINHLSTETKDMELWRAILMSCSIPFVFKPVSWNKNTYVDGSLAEHFPLLKVKSENIKTTIGFKVVSDTIHKYNSLIDYIYVIPSVIANTKHNIETFKVIEILIPKGKLDGILDLCLTGEQRKDLINIGFRETIGKIK